MNSLKTKLTILTTSLLLALTLLLLLPLLAAGTKGHNPLPLTVRAAPLAQSAVISGTYLGTIAISMPVQLGVLDLAFDLSDSGSAFSGAIDPSRTLVYSGAPTLNGGLTSNGITPTFRLDSELFSDFVSGRQVQRSFSLFGEVWEDGEILYGQYTETITGFTPQPLTMQGLFMVVRPEPNQGGTEPLEDSIFLPLILKSGA